MEKSPQVNRVNLVSLLYSQDKAAWRF